MHALYSVILIGCLHIQGGCGSFQYFYTQPIPPYYPVYNPAPQIYVQQPSYFATPDEQDINERPVKVPDTINVGEATINNYANDEKYLGFGYRTEHDNGHSNVIFISSSHPNQLDSSFSDVFKIPANNLTETAKNIASNAVDSNAKIEFPESNDFDDTILGFLKKPVTSFYAFYTVNDKVVAKDNYQAIQPNDPSLINNRILDLFARFGLDTQTNLKEMNQAETIANSESRLAKALDINETTSRMTIDVEASTQVITPNISTTESTTAVITEESTTNVPENTSVDPPTTEAIILTTNDKIETLA